MLSMHEFFMFHSLGQDLLSVVSQPVGKMNQDFLKTNSRMSLIERYQVSFHCELMQEVVDKLAHPTSILGPPTCVKALSIALAEIRTTSVGHFDSNKLLDPV